jgi:(2Fe-2S) ferredoxin
MKRNKRLARVQDLVALRNLIQKKGVLDPEKKRIKVCGGTGCRANQSIKVAEELLRESHERSTEVEIITTGCQGLCQKGPVITIDPLSYFYQKVKPENAKDIMFKTITQEKPIWDLLYRRKTFIQH